MSKTTSEGLTPSGLEKPWKIGVRVALPAGERWAAEQAAREYAEGGLAEVLAAFASDLVTARERPGSWEAERVNAWLASHPWPERAREAAPNRRRRA